MPRFTLYETASRFFYIGTDILEEKYKVLKIDRTAGQRQLALSEDGVVYSKTEIEKLINTLDEGNKASGGLKRRCINWGLLGFIRFTGNFYMLLITKRSQAALIGGHYIYRVDGTELISLAPEGPAKLRSDAHPEEARYLGIFHNLDLNQSFYFSYSYDITNTLQRYLATRKHDLLTGHPTAHSKRVNDMFVWNHYLLEPAAQVLAEVYDWCIALVHGFTDQCSG